MKCKKCGQTISNEGNFELCHECGIAELTRKQTRKKRNIDAVQGFFMLMTVINALLALMEFTRIFSKDFNLIELVSLGCSTFITYGLYKETPKLFSSPEQSNSKANP